MHGLNSINKAPSFGEILNGISNIFGNALLNIFCNAGDIMRITTEYNNAMSDYNFWLRQHYQFLISMPSKYNNLIQLLESKCPDGSYRINIPYNMLCSICCCGILNLICFFFCGFFYSCRILLSTVNFCNCGIVF